ncbi:sugar phosphate nucleotidyltransferase [Treponema sp.]
MNKPTLVVLAAGLGSRYGGLKQIDAVGMNGETLLDYASYDAISSGFGKVLYVIRRDLEKGFRERLFDRIAKNCAAEYVFQSQKDLLSDEQINISADRTKPWGTIHALLCAKNNIVEPFAVINADDYYGRKAYKSLANHFYNVSESSGEHAMVAYELEKTMTRSGSVSRAICSVRDNYLASLHENTNIRFEGQKVITNIDGIDRELTGREWVSMNFFGFLPEALDYFDDYFKRFLKENVSSEKNEAYLPEGASEMVASKAGRIRVYTSQENWFGMTYKNDREKVRQEIASKLDQKYYPSPLWENS